MMKGTLEQCPL